MTSFAISEAVLTRARDVADEISQRGIAVDADEIITGRAALLGLACAGQTSAGGATRLLAAADSWWALTLSRPDDVEAVPALLERSDIDDDPWPALAVVGDRPAAELVERARLLGLPAAVLGETPAAAPKILPHNETAARTLADLLVVDLSSMWAGPLCGRLLAAAGATVVKVETRSRPDGTRAGDPSFFDWMNSEKLSYAVDLDSDELSELLRAADIVIEGSRPGALARRGLDAHHMRARPGRVWLRITGYGSEHPDRVAFGDDAAVAGGLVGYDDGRPTFCGDAIADPLTGLEATLTLLDTLARGGGTIVEAAMAAVAATYAALPTSRQVDVPARKPTPPRHPARELGADNADVRRLISARRVAC
jgi:CoA-transferase family III